jgi:hypothetical protein
MAEYANILPADENTKGNVWCAVCEQSIRAANEERHLISAKHAENAEAHKAAAAAEAKKASKAEKPPKKAEDAAAKAEKAAKPAQSAKKAGDAEEKPVKAPKAAKASKTAEVSGASISDTTEAEPESASLALALPLDPNPAPGKEGNRYCGICEQSLGPAKVKSHLGSKKHQANADKVLANAMQKVAV